MTHDAEQDAQLRRVTSAIEDRIMTFWAIGLRQFHVSELLAFVRERTPAIAPDSPGRILRSLRQRGLLNYKIINRKQSLYEFVPLPEKRQPVDLSDNAGITS